MPTLVNKYEMKARPRTKGKTEKKPTDVMNESKSENKTEEVPIEQPQKTTNKKLGNMAKCSPRMKFIR